MAINELISKLYQDTENNDLIQHFLLRLKSVITYSYSSYLMADKSNPHHLYNPICVPSSFAEAEQKYIEIEDKDHLAWVIDYPETMVFSESEIISDKARLLSPIYQECYGHYGIYDTLQMSLVYHNILLGIVTLYRTKELGLFTQEDKDFLSYFSIHLNYIIYNKTYQSDGSKDRLLKFILSMSNEYSLTNRESEILFMIYENMNNSQIAKKCNISINSLYKHVQNIYRKVGVSSRPALLKFFTRWALLQDNATTEI